MNFSNCIGMAKKLFLLLIIVPSLTSSILQAKDTKTSETDLAQQSSAHVVADTTPDLKINEQLAGKIERKEQLTPEEKALLEEELLTIFEHQYMAEFPKILRGQLQIMYSKLESVRLMLSNNALHLSISQRDAFLKEIENIRNEIQKNAPIFEGTEKAQLALVIQFNKQLLACLSFNIKNGLKKIKPFKFIPNTRASNQKLLLVKEIDNLNNELASFENEFKQLGITYKEKLSRRWELFNREWGITRKGILAGTTAFGGLLAYYLLIKDHNNPHKWLHDQKNDCKAILHNNLATPMQQTDASDRLQELNDLGNNLSAIEGIMQAEKAFVYDNSAWGNFKKVMFENPVARFIDERIIGTRPAKKFGTFGGEIDDPHSGTGFFGTVETYKPEFAGLIGFMALAKAFIDKCIEDINTWKGLGKDPKGFFKFRELFHNEKQAVSPIEELFLMHAIEEIKPEITFDNLAGLHEQKQALAPVIRYLLNPDLFEKTGTTIERGYLLYGPTRTGKTHFAEALAGELIIKYKKPLSFFKIRGSELRGGLWGGSFKKVFELLQKYAPCLVFLDEIDLLNLQRDQNSALLEEFLTCWKTNDASHRDIIVLAATNRIDHIDHALLQPGRFGKTITFENPAIDDRREFFHINLVQKNVIDPKSIDLERLSHETEGCTFGDLSSIVNDALAQATQLRQKITYHHFDTALDSYKRKIVHADISLPAEERQLMAAHLAGHALAYLELGTSEQLHKVTMLPIQKKVHEEKIWLSELTVAKKITSYGDVFTLHKQNTAGFDTPAQKINKAKAQLAGHAAEKVLLGASAYSYHADTEEARLTIEGLVFKGLKKEHLSRDGADQKLNEINNLLQKYEDEMVEFMQERKDKLEKIAKALNQNLTLSLEEIQELIRE